MGKVHKIIGLFMVTFIAFTVCGCAREEKELQSEQVQIGMAFDSFVIERWQRDKKTFIDTAANAGAEVIVQNANGDVEKQIEQVRYLMEKKVDAIVIIPVDAEKITDVIQEAKAEGIIIIAYDRMIKNADADLYISFDNESVGRMMGEAMVEAGIVNKNVLMLGGPESDSNVAVVEAAFQKIMEESNNRIVASIHCTNWKAEDASSYIYENENIVEAVDAIMCGNDNIASKVMYALTEKRLAGKVAVTGQDADVEACQRIVEGTQIVTIYKSVDTLASTAAECTLKLINDQELENTSYINDGTYEIPYIALEPVSVTKNNLDEVIIESGFHSREDVYLNLPSTN